MADFVAFDKDYINSFSIYDALDFKEKDIDKNYYCLCGNQLFVKNESIEFKNKNGCIIQRHAHFSHYKNCDCKIKRIFEKKNKNEITFKIGDAPERTELTKRIKIIYTILSTYKISYNTYNKYKSNVIMFIENAKKSYKVDADVFEDLMDENIKKLIHFKTSGIGFKDIEYKDIEPNKFYYITDLFLGEEKSLGVISYSLLYRICEDFERYKIIVKKLSLIAMFASRCINFNAFEISSFDFINKATQKINQIRLLK